MDLGDQHLFRLALHEIRTPLTAVQLNAQLIERSLGKLGLEKECRLAGTIISAARKMDELTQELGDIARLISGKVALDLRAHDLTRLLPDILSHQVGVMDGSRIRMAIPAGPLLITVDARRLDRIVANLISIGLRLDVGGTGLDLRVSTTEAEVQIHITVTTDAHGDRVAVPSDEELGFGFLVARTLIECHGGGLEVQNGPACEVVLRCSLPIAGRA
jgi:K+-sensing histidine kinase KdpD